MDKNYVSPSLLLQHLSHDAELGLRLYHLLKWANDLDPEKLQTKWKADITTEIGKVKTELEGTMDTKDQALKTAILAEVDSKIAAKHPEA